MFAASSIKRDLGFGEVSLTMLTTFPYGREVEIKVVTPVAASFTIRVRMPCWAASNIVVELNGAGEVVGTPGTYVELTREWSDGDVVGFTLRLASQPCSTPVLTKLRTIMTVTP